MKTLGYMNHSDVWVHHNLMEKKLMEGFSICDSLLKHNKSHTFLKTTITGNKKWIVYNNVDLKRSQGKWNEPLFTTPYDMVCIGRSWCCVSGGIERALCFMNSFHKIEFRQALLLTGLIKGSNQCKVFEIGQMLSVPYLTSIWRPSKIW